MRQMHRILAALAFGAILSSGVLLAGLGLALADGPEVEITFPVADTYSVEDWNAGCDSVGFCGSATDGVTGSGVQISIQKGAGDLYWHADVTSFATGSAVFFPAFGFENWSFNFLFGNFPADGEYTVQAQATDNSGNVAASHTATFNIATDPATDPATGSGVQKFIREGKPRAFVGEVQSGPGYPDTFYLEQQGTGEGVVIHLPYTPYNFKTPGGPNKGEFGVGARVVVKVRWIDEKWVVQRGLVKPVKPSFTPSVGVVVSQENGELTLTLPNGKIKVVKVSADSGDLELGEVVTVFSQPVDADGETAADADGETVVEATGLVRASKVRQRLEKFLKDVNESEGELPEKARKARSKRIANIALALEGHSAKHVAILQGLADRQDLPSHARGVIGRALKSSKLERDKSLKIAASAREKAGPPEDRGKPDSAGQGNTGRANTSLAGQGEKGKGKPDSAGQGNTGRANTSLAGQGEKGHGKPDSAGQGNTGRANTSSVDKGDKGQNSAVGRVKKGRDR